MKEKLLKLLDNAYAPYSNYKVAAIVVMKDGNEFAGVNVENASYGASICAERNAINSAVTKGYKKGDFQALYLMVKQDKITFPCFICRQTLTEFFNMNDDLYLLTTSREEHYHMKDILVYPFSSEDLR
ncbi:MAG: cytidine deaminase [Bacilli bacterium]|nr:cytidine deaminase [Bacilli bacterium]